MTQRDEPLESSEGFRHLTFAERGFPSAACPSPDLKAGLLKAAKDADVIHNHSLWLMPNVYPGMVARATGTPLVMAPRGAMSGAALKHSRWRKRLFWHLLQKRAFRTATLLHATAEQEFTDIRALGEKAPVAIVANGVDMPPADTVAEKRPYRTLLFLARVHPLKGLPLLLDVWRDLSADCRKGWRLRIVGPDELDHTAELKEICLRYGLQDVDFVGPITGVDRDREYASADLHIHPTHGENFGMVIAEALASGTPVITTTRTPWQGLLEHRCGWWVDRSHAALTAALAEALSRPAEDLAGMGARGRRWVQQSFGWNGIARQMIEAYEWLVRGCPSPAPDCVRLDG
jgi:glycosyltransferase involved in cell wall biosynthesis